MKKICALILVLPLLLISCKKTPVAGFHTDTVEPEVGQTVFFYNDSQDADRFEWDFGDGYTTNEPNPTHIFNSTGTYEVTLKAISKSNLEDNSSLTLDVLVPTLLVVEVREYYQDYIVPDASIILYPTLVDWDDQTNEVTDGFTDQNGVAVFSGLDPFVYYLDIWEQNHDNYDLRSEDVGFIRTPEVAPHQINYFTAYVDYVQHVKGAVKRSRSLVVKKLERKASGRLQSHVGLSAATWQELYDRRVNKK